MWTSGHPAQWPLVRCRAGSCSCCAKAIGPGCLAGRQCCQSDDLDPVRHTSSPGAVSTMHHQHATLIDGNGECFDEAIGPGAIVESLQPLLPAAGLSASICSCNRPAVSVAGCRTQAGLHTRWLEPDIAVLAARCSAPSRLDTIPRAVKAHGCVPKLPTSWARAGHCDRAVQICECPTCTGSYSHCHVYSRCVLITCNDLHMPSQVPAFTKHS